MISNRLKTYKKTVLIVIVVIFSILTILIFAPSFLMKKDGAKLVDINISTFKLNVSANQSNEYIEYIKITVLKKVDGFVWGKLHIKYKNNSIAILQVSILDKSSDLSYILPVFSKDKIFELSEIEAKWDEVFVK